MYFEDLQPYTYLDSERDALTVGWLDAEHPFATGDVPDAAVERLREQCRDRRVNQTRGFHLCPLCPRPAPEDGPPMPQQVSDGAGGEFTVGTAEIRVDGADARYAAPDMVIHYVEAHGYLPPADFVQGLLT